MGAILIALALFATAVHAAPRAGVDLKKISARLRDHQTYPASRAELLVTCFGLEDFSPEERKWFIATVPEGKYTSAQQLLAVISKK